MSWVQSSALHKVGTGSNSYTLSIQEIEAGGSGIQGYPWLHRKSKVSLVYVKLCLKGEKIAEIPG